LLPATAFGPLGVSPDDREVLFEQSPEAGIDLMIVRDFK
jgi:hypothetical protein